jgi:hypothetical protein
MCFEQPIPKQFLKEKEPWPKPIPSLDKRQKKTEATVISKIKYPPSTRAYVQP